LSARTDADDLALLPQREARAPGAPTTINDIERDAIEWALTATAGNRRHAARELDKTRRC